MASFSGVIVEVLSKVVESIAPGAIVNEISGTKCYGIEREMKRKQMGK